MYDMQLGRWQVTDPLSEKYTGLSGYAMTANNPINLSDKNGRDWDWGVQRDDDGNITGIKLTVNGKILDRTGRFDGNELSRLKTAYQKGAESTLKAKSNGVNISVAVNLSVACSIAEVSQTDHLINIISDNAMTEARGEDTDGVSERGGLNIWIRESSVESTLKSGGARTFVHELGHTGGLKHPLEQPDDHYQIDIDATNLTNNNVHNFMWGSQDQLIDFYGVHGTNSFENQRVVPNVIYNKNFNYVDRLQLLKIQSNTISNFINKQYGWPSVPSKEN